jgi:two-component system cell cycle response regulator CtrA
MRALLIEDDIAMARSIELMLRGEGLNVYTTNLGEEGVDLGTLYNYDIIVLDMQLPDMSGFEVLMALRVAKVQTPVIILSGNAIVETKVKALGFGADDYITKPLHKDELIARIQAVVRRSTKQSLGAYRNNTARLPGGNELSNLAVANVGGNYVKTEWKTGYMLRDLDGGQVVVA